MSNFANYLSGEITQEELTASLLENFTPEHPKIVEMMAALKNESDRGIALAGLAFFDEALKELLLEYFKFGVSRFGVERTEKGVISAGKELLRFENLGNYFNKLNLAYVLGLIQETTFEDLKVAGNIRNKFAHHINISSFKDKRISSLLKNIKMPLEGIENFGPDEIDRHTFVGFLGGAFVIVVGMTTMLQKGFPVHMMNLRETDS